MEAARCVCDLCQSAVCAAATESCHNDSKISVKEQFSRRVSVNKASIWRLQPALEDQKLQFQAQHALLGLESAIVGWKMATCGESQEKFCFCFHAFTLKLKQKTIRELFKKVVQQKWFCFGMFYAFSGQDYSSFLLPWTCWVWHLLLEWTGSWRMQSPPMERLSRSLLLTDCSLGTQTNVPGARADRDLDVSHSIHLHQNQPHSCSQAAAALFTHLCIVSRAAEPSLTISHISISSMREKSRLIRVLNVHKPKCVPNLINQHLKGRFTQIQHYMLLW